MLFRSSWELTHACQRHPPPPRTALAAAASLAQRCCITAAHFCLINTTWCTATCMPAALPVTLPTLCCVLSLAPCCSLALPGVLRHGYARRPAGPQGAPAAAGGSAAADGPRHARRPGILGLQAAAPSRAQLRVVAAQLRQRRLAQRQAGGRITRRLLACWVLAWLPHPAALRPGVSLRVFCTVSPTPKACCWPAKSLGAEATCRLPQLPAAPPPSTPTPIV